MNTEHCAEIADAQRIELKSGLPEPGKNCRDYGFLVLAGILTGLGVGLLFDHPGSGFLVGLGLGLAGSGLLPLAGKPRQGECRQLVEMNVTTLLIGAFLILIGISVVWAPVAVWPYAFAGLLILVGIWVVIRGFSHLS